MNVVIIVWLNVMLILYTFLREASCEELYVGCYTFFSGLASNKNPIQSISQCLNECRSQISSFAAIKDGSSCYCGNITNTRVPSSNCNLTCAVVSGTCGGNNVFAVYTDIPTYQGCYKDDIDNRDMNLSKSDDWTMTMDKCYENCSSSNYIFMGVQNGGTCFCGQQYGKHGRAPETECNMTCTGNGNQICGGPARNSVYSVGYLPGLNKSYSEVFHCLNGATDRNGTCSSKTCQPGWKGTKCNQRDCTISNDYCEQHKCAEVKIGNQVISECVCKEGFQSISMYDECTDIDECQISPCNEPSETCNNTVGSYKCTCSPGYNYINQLGCNDQCNGSLYECENLTTCVKVQNYKCLSKDSNTWPSNVGKIVGGVVGTLAIALLLAAIATLGYCLFIKGRKKSNVYKKYIPKSDTGQEISTFETNKIIVSEVNDYYKNHKKDINEQFNKCRKDFGHPQLVAGLPENVSKNRFKKMVPYDHNRVNLNDKNDYINASFIQTYGNSTNMRFIAAQGPKLETAEDFWKMIWDNNVSIVVMLTRCYENDKEKCFQYWPDESDNDMKIGDFVIQNDKEENRLNYIRKTFKVVRNNEEREVCHFLYVAWMDKTVPDNVFSLMNLREKVMTLVDKKSKKTIVVHCSAGVGRTGTFIALDYLLRQAEQEGCVDFYECLKFLRNQRCNMIQSPKQYELCFRAIAMFHMIGKSTFISTDDSNAFKIKMQEPTDELLQKQFDLIEEEVGGNKVDANNKANIKCKSGLLEAVFAPSSQKASSYVIGVMTSSFEGEDLLSIFDANTSIFILLDNQEITFLPKDHQQIRHTNGCIQLSDTMAADFCMKYSFKIDAESRVAYENTGCTDNPYVNALPNAFLLHVSKNVTTSFDVITRLYSVVKPTLNQKDKRVTVLSRDGYKDAGFLIAAFNVLQMIDISKEVDVYETVFELRNIQPEIINNIDLFKNLYSFVKHIMNQPRSILNTGLKTMMESQEEHSEYAD